jgi:hypothetical protein
LPSGAIRAILVRVRERQICVGCGKQSPETETNYTLISAQFGWRLSRARTGDGTLLVEWRCPNCWREYKRHLPAGAVVEKHPASEAPPDDGAERRKPSMKPAARENSASVAHRSGGARAPSPPGRTRPKAR